MTDADTRGYPNRVWPRRYRTYWCVVDSRGVAYLISARITRAKAIAAFLDDADKIKRDWAWWRRTGYSCQRCDIKVRNYGGAK